jgi:hypothetical protein
VRRGAIETADGRTDWHRDALLVVTIPLALVPILLPPALLIAASLVLWNVVEWIAWVPLELNCWRQTRRGQPAKTANTPSLTFRL